MEFTGTIVTALPLQEGVSKKGTPWKKQEFVIENNSGQPSQSIVFTVFGERIDKLQEQGLQAGAVGKVSIDSRAREYNGRYYNDLTAWAWEPAPSWEKAAQEKPQGNAVYYPDSQLQSEQAISPQEQNLPF